MLTKDLIEKISTEKYYLEHELLWLFNTESLSHNDKVEKILDILSKINECDSKLILVEKYFESKQPTEQPLNQLELDLK